MENINKAKQLLENFGRDIIMRTKTMIDIMEQQNKSELIERMDNDNVSLNEASDIIFETICNIL